MDSMTDLNAQKFPDVGMLQVDLDDIWALRDCYGFDSNSPAQLHFMYTHTLPLLLDLLDEAAVHATFFVVGKDLEYEPNIELLHDLIRRGHRVASHSWQHRLEWRNLDTQTMHNDLAKTEQIMQDKLGVTPLGFRTPGYAFTGRTLEVLADRNYRYDSSLMPSPWGWIFRYADSKMAARTGIVKTQFPLFRDAFHSLRPRQPIHGQPLFEFPVATAPFTRLPLQIGVCMRLGMPWLKGHLRLMKSLALPYIMLMHLTDLCDFQALNHPFFLKQKFFARPAIEKQEFVRQALWLLKQNYGNIEPLENRFTN